MPDVWRSQRSSCLCSNTHNHEVIYLRRKLGKTLILIPCTEQATPASPAKSLSGYEILSVKLTPIPLQALVLLIILLQCKTRRNRLKGHKKRRMPLIPMVSAVTQDNQASLDYHWQNIQPSRDRNKIMPRAWCQNSSCFLMDTPM
jgi:hypothetical protein